MADRRPVRLADRVTGPLEAWAVGFAGHLTGLGYSASTVGQQVWLMAELSDWLEAEGGDAAALSPIAVQGFAATLSGGRSRRTSSRALAPMLDYLREQGAAPEPREGPLEGRAAVVAEYRRYLSEQRRLCQTTISAYVAYATEFLSAVGEPLAEHLAGLTGGQVLNVLSDQLQLGRRPASAVAVVRADRALLRFLHATGRISRQLDVVVPAAAGRRPRLPEPLPASAVRALLDGCDRTSETGSRDYAVLMLLRRYGTRRIEIARLQLCDLRWRAGEVVLHGKGGRDDVLPLLADVGEAIVAYLRIRRPAPSGVGAVFLTVHAPTRPLSSAAVMLIVRRACDRAGISRIGSRVFRHTLGCDLLAAGATLTEIKDVLRHEDIETTAGYARVAMPALAPLVRRWPITRADSETAAR
jgi:site-specific recombinase XerD